MGETALRDAIDALEPSPYEHAIIDKFECLDRLLASLVSDLDRFDRDGMWAVCGATSLRNWLNSSCRRTGRDATAIVSMMRLLRSLPHTATAFVDGTLAKGHVDVIGANVNERTLSDFADVETDMVPLIANLSVKDTTTVMKLWAERARFANADERKPRPENETDHLHVAELLDGQTKVDAVLTGTNAVTFKARSPRACPNPSKVNPPAHTHNAKPKPSSKWPDASSKPPTPPHDAPLM